MLVHSVSHRSLELNIIVCMRLCCCGWLAECTKRFMYFPSFLFAEGTMWDAERFFRRYYGFHSKTKTCQNHTRVIPAAVARTMVFCPQRSRCIPARGQFAREKRVSRMDYTVTTARARAAWIKQKDSVGIS